MSQGIDRDTLAPPCCWQLHHGQAPQVRAVNAVLTPSFCHRPSIRLQLLEKTESWDALERNPPFVLTTTPVYTEIMEHATPFGGIARIGAYIMVAAMVAYVVHDAVRNSYMLEKNTEVGEFDFEEGIAKGLPKRPEVFYAEVTFVGLDFPDVCRCDDLSGATSMNVALTATTTNPPVVACNALPDISGCTVNVTVTVPPYQVLEQHFALNILAPRVSRFASCRPPRHP